MKTLAIKLTVEEWEFVTQALVASLAPLKEPAVKRQHTLNALSHIVKSLALKDAPKS